MVQGYTQALKRILREHGCRYLRPGKGDHEVWLCPNATKPIIVDGKIMSRSVANAILKQASIKAKL